MLIASEIYLMSMLPKERCVRMCVFLCVCLCVQVCPDNEASSNAAALQLRHSSHSNMHDGLESNVNITVHSKQQIG